MKITHDFKLPFEWPKKEAFSAGDEGYDRDAHLKALKAAIISWVNEDYYYLLPLKSGWDFGLLMIHWDDVSTYFEVDACCRVRDCPDAEKAAQAMLEALFESWNVMNDDDPGECPFHSFLRNR